MDATATGAPRDSGSGFETAIPCRAGVGFKTEHAAAILAEPQPLGWFEVHPENYMVAGGIRPRLLEALRAEYPLSLHGVGLSLGGAEPLNEQHLAALRALVERFGPGLVSEHVAWSSHAGRCLPDLLPIPFSERSLRNLVEHIDRAQEALGQRILIENPSSYFALPASAIPEVEFIEEAARRTGCRLLLDVNNVYVSAHNLGFDACAYVDAVCGERVEEIHLAGHAIDRRDGDTVLIDDHGSEVVEPVWTLYERLTARIGPRPTLIEWDNDLPEWPVLRAQAERAEHLVSRIFHHRERTAW